MIRRTTDDLSVRTLAHILAAGDGADRGALPALDWTVLLSLADATALGPPLWAASRRLGLLTPVPPTLLAHRDAWPVAHPAAALEATYDHNQRRTADLRDQVAIVAGALATIDVMPVALKGTAMVLAGVWTDPAERQMNDVDLLVPARAASDARRVVLGLGYEESREVAPSLHHLPPLRRSDRFGSFELHVRPLTNAWRGVLDAAEVTAGATPVSVGDATVLVPSREVLATHALAHAHLSDSSLARGTIPLRATYEVWRLERQLGSVDWDLVRSHLARVKRGGVVDRHRRFAGVLFDGDRDPHAERELALPLAMLRWPVLRRVRHAAWRAAHVLDEDRLREHYGDDLNPIALRLHHLRAQADKLRR